MRDLGSCSFKEWGEEKEADVLGLAVELRELVVEHMVQFGDADLWEWAPAAVPGPRQVGRWSLLEAGAAVLGLLSHGPDWQPGAPVRLQGTSFPADSAFPRTIFKSSFASSGFT